MRLIFYFAAVTRSLHAINEVYLILSKRNGNVGMDAGVQRGEGDEGVWLRVGAGRGGWVMVRVGG